MFVLDVDDEILAKEAIANMREVLTAFCARYFGATTVMDEGAHFSTRASAWTPIACWTRGA